MSQEEYVKLEAVRQALEKVVKDDEAIEGVLELLSDSTVKVDETQTQAEVEDTGSETEKEGEDLPKVKKQYVIVVSDKDGVIKKDIVGWVLQIPEDEDVQEVLGNINKAAYNFNTSKKGRKYPIHSVGLALEAIGAKYFKPYQISVKTKEPVLVLTTNNEIPKE